MSNLLRNVGLPDMGVGYQKFQAGSPDGYLDFGVISTPAGLVVGSCWSGKKYFCGSIRFLVNRTSNGKLH